MAIVREFCCRAHGPFESKRQHPRCPRGCSAKFVVQEFRTAPPLLGARTKRIDAELSNLAKSYGLSDLKTDGKDSVMTSLRKRPDFKPLWGQVPHAQSGFSRDPNISVPTVTAQQFGAQPGVNIQSMKPLFPGPKPILAAPPFRPPME